MTVLTTTVQTTVKSVMLCVCLSVHPSVRPVTVCLHRPAICGSPAGQPRPIAVSSIGTHPPLWLAAEWPWRHLVNAVKTYCQPKQQHILPSEVTHIFSSVFVQVVSVALNTSSKEMFEPQTLTAESRRLVTAMLINVLKSSRSALNGRWMLVSAGWLPIPIMSQRAAATDLNASEDCATTVHGDLLAPRNSSFSEYLALRRAPSAACQPCSSEAGYDLSSSLVLLSSSTSDSLPIPSNRDTCRNKHHYNIQRRLARQLM